MTMLFIEFNYVETDSSTAWFKTDPGNRRRGHLSSEMGTHRHPDWHRCRAGGVGANLVHQLGQIFRAWHSGWIHSPAPRRRRGYEPVFISHEPSLDAPSGHNCGRFGGWISYLEIRSADRRNWHECRDSGIPQQREAQLQDVDLQVDHFGHYHWRRSHI